MAAVHDIFIPDRAALAPLAGVTDSVFRRICAGFGACPVMTEMVSSDGYVRQHGSDKSARLLRFNESERPIGFQFFGADPDMMAEAVQKAHDLKPDFIDINAGCPVKKVISKGSGSALMGNLDLLARIVKKVAAVSKVPVTVKIRAGWDHSNINAVEVASRCADSGAQAIIVHPRTKSQGFSGVSDWSLLRSVNEEVSVPVIGSGDVTTPEDALRMKEETGVDYVMVGRGAMGNPWIFSQIAKRFAGAEVPMPPDINEKLELALKHLEKLAAETSERYAVLNMRKFFGWYSKGIRGATDFRQNIFRAQTIKEVRNTVLYFQVNCGKNSLDNLSYIEMVGS